MTTEQAPTREKRHFSLIRSFALADVITLANAACGTSSIFFCLNYADQGRRSDLWIALALLPLALVFDVLDGSVARWRHKHSLLGADLDSLADVVSFGVAPAVVAWTMGMRGGIDALVLVFFVCCGISRLARYNATAATLSDESGKVRYYEGTPIPTSLLLVAALAVAFARGAVGEQMWLGVFQVGPTFVHPLVAMFALSGAAMISGTLRIPKP